MIGIRRLAGLLAATIVGTGLVVPLTAAPASAAECNQPSHVFTTVANGATITTGDTFALSGVVKPATGAQFNFHVVRPNGKERDFVVFTNLAGSNTNCVIPHQAETIPAAFVGKGFVTVFASFTRWEDGTRGEFRTSFTIAPGSGFNPAPLPATVSCGDASHPFVTESPPFLAFSGIVYPGTRMFFTLDLRLGTAIAFTIINPTVSASGNCVLPHQLDVLRRSSLVLANQGARTDIYATYVRWEDGVTVQDQFVGTIS